MGVVGHRHVTLNLHRADCYRRPERGDGRAVSSIERAQREEGRTDSTHQKMSGYDVQSDDDKVMR